MDAMSGFGVKSPLRRLIIVEEYMFNSADELCEKMKVVFADDVEKSQKIYKVIPIRELNQERRKTVGIEIAGCQKARMISFHADGTYQLRQRLCNCEHCSIGNFDECEDGDEITSNGLMDDIEDELADLDEGCITEDLYGLTVPNSYVGLYSASNFEVFYLFYITEKGIASETMHDIHGHIVQKGQAYLRGYYLQKEPRETRKHVYYKKGKQLAYVHPDSVFCPNVAFNEEEMCMEKIIYVSLCQFMLN